MSTTVASHRSFALWGFPLVYIGWAYLFWSPVLGSTSSVWTYPTVLFFLVGGASPLIAGLGLAYLTGGPARVHDLLHRTVDVGRITAGWWVVILGFWLAFDLLQSGLAILIGVSDQPITVALTGLTDPGTLGFWLLLSFVFPLVEEIGLRGYYLDRLQERFGPAVAGLLNGGTWAVWHAPFVWFPGYYAGLTYSPELWWWLPSIVLHTLLIVWVYNGTHRSVLAVTVFHGMLNFTGLALGLAPEMEPFGLVGLSIAAVALVLYWRRRNPPTAIGGSH